MVAEDRYSWNNYYEKWQFCWVFHSKAGLLSGRVWWEA
jgi:hypothetical protein